MRSTPRLERLIRASLHDDDCPSSEQLADYALGALLGNEQLQVAAHVRGCPLCQQLIAICTPPRADDLVQMAAEAAAPRLRLPVRVARLVPVAPALGMRGVEDQVRQYRSADIVVELTWTPPDDESWHLTGRVFRNDTPLSDQTVTLRGGRRRHTATSDILGFFAFPDLPGGRYTLAVVADGVEVQLRGIVLSHAEL